MATFVAKDDEAKAKAGMAFREVLGVVGESLDARGPFLLGEQFSAADVVIGSVMLWSSANGWLDDQTTLTEYALRLGERPAYKASLD